MEQITESLKHQFASNLTLDEQEASKLTKYVTNETIDTERAQFESMGRVDAYIRDRVEVGGVGSYGHVNAGALGYDAANEHSRMAAGARGDGHQVGAANAANRMGLDFTKYDFTETKRREITAVNHVVAITMDRADKINILQDPTSKYTRIVNDAMGKAKDQAIIRAFSKIVRGGLDGSNAIYFNVLNNVVPLGIGLISNNNSFVPASNNDITRLNDISSILKQASEAGAADGAHTAAATKAAAIAIITNDNVGAELKARFDAEINAVVGTADAPGQARVVAYIKAMSKREKQLASAIAHSPTSNILAGGLTVDKLILARQLLNKGTFNAGKKMYLVVSEQQIADLLHNYQVVSSDYSNVKSLVDGTVESFMGFQIIKSEWLGGLKATNGDHAIRECWAFTEDSMRFATVKNSKVTYLDKLERHHYAPSIYHSESFGAARAGEGGIVCIKCLEPTHSISNLDDGSWISVEDGNNAATNKFKSLYAGVVPSGNLTWAAGRYADNQVHSYGAAAALTEAQIVQVAGKK